MRTNIRYVVTKGNATFEIGDKIIPGTDGSIHLCGGLGGWISPMDSEAALEGAEYKMDEGWVRSKINQAKQDMDFYSEVLEEILAP